MLIVLAVLPLASGLLRQEVGFLIAACAPMVIGAFCLMPFVFLRENDLKQWCFGVGATALVFLTIGLVLFGLEPTYVFGERPRTLIGFVHPAQTASAVVATAMFALILLGRIRRSHKRLASAGFVICLVVTVFLLEIVQSRNTLLAVGVGITCYLFIRKEKQQHTLHLAVSILVLALPLLLYVYCSLGSPESPLWSFLDGVSSGRLSLYRLGIEHLAQQDLRSLLTGPTKFVRPELVAIDQSDFRGFTAIDSVFLTFALNYGLLSMCVLFLFFVVLGSQVASSNNQRLGFALFCGLIVFFSLDGAGVTPSHLIGFIGFGYLLRSASHSPGWRLIAGHKTTQQAIP
jgi:hypothetical protein